MEIEFLGANCLKISTKKATAFVDPVIPGKKIDTSKAKVVAITNQKLLKYQNGDFMIETPGEYEISGLSVQGIAAQAHTDEEGTEGAVIYKIIHDNVSVLVVGHIMPNLSDDQLEAIGMVDILAIPVGGNGYTIDATGAAQLTRKIEPKMVVPTHYAEKGVKYEVPQAEVGAFLEDMAASPVKEDKIKIGKNTVLPEQLKVIVLNRA
jgi:L-ascorbate metabolism protein UlaG (beta-lactamase superfamily)